MRVLVVLVVLVAAACGDDDGGSAGAADAATGLPDTAVVVDAAGAPDAAPACDPVAQDCAGAAEKCTLVSDGARHPACLPVSGQVALGDACVRENELFGHDDCAPGLFCTFINVLPPSAGGTRRCRELCNLTADCEAGERCATFDDDDPPHGVCAPPCTAFAGTCPAQMTCADPYSDTAGLFDVFLTCRFAGQVAPGGACSAPEDCAADTICLDPSLGSNTECYALCDATHPCGGGATCTAISAAVSVCPM